MADTGYERAASGGCGSTLRSACTASIERSGYCRTLRDSQRSERAQSHPLQAQPAPQSHAEPQAHVPVQEQEEVQTQPVDVMPMVLASFVVVFMTYLSVWVTSILPGLHE